MALKSTIYRAQLDIIELVIGLGHPDGRRHAEVLVGLDRGRPG
jgi:hypothetical protein